MSVIDYILISMVMICIGLVHYRYSIRIIKKKDGEILVWRCVECHSCGILANVPDIREYDSYLESGLEHGIAHSNMTGHTCTMERRVMRKDWK